MFDFIRSHRRWMQLVLLLLVVPAFAFFGIEGYVGFMSRDKELAEVNGVAITQPEYDAVRRNQLEELRRVLGAQFDAEALDTPTFRERILNDMINQRVIAEAAMQGRYTVSDEQLRETIAKIPAVQENGVFSPERYRQVLAAQGMTPADFEMRVRSDLILSQVLGPIGSTAAAPKRVADELMAALTQQRTVALRRFNAQGFEADVQVTDADIQAWYDANAEQLRLPESVDVEYVVLDEAAASRGLSVPAAEIEAYYQQNQSRFGQPEQRRVSHILREVATDADQSARDAALAKAQELANQLKADPSQFAKLAAEFSEDPGSSGQGGDLGWISKDTLVPEVEEAVFKLEPNTISEVIQSPFGYHVAVVTQVQPASVKPLEQVRDEVQNEVLRQMASVRFADLASELTNLVYDQRDALEPIAQQLGLELKRAQAVARSGLLPDELFFRSTPLQAGQAEILGNPRVLQVAFSPEVFQDKLNSGVIETSPGSLVALRVTQVNPSSVPPLEQVKELIREDLVAQGALKLAREAGKAALTVIADGSQPAIGFAAAEVVSRQDPRNLSPVELDAVMKLSESEVPKVIGVDTPIGYSLLEVKAVNPGEPLPDANQAQFKGQLAQAWGGAEEQAALLVLRRLFNVQILPDARVLIDGNDAGT
ncbi:SurA N-terminal domain-containing protein [Orrella daihaiensis]|uniref:Periplasmic chaperone PpiD n=1 Tax=Orrella daihaiensis TaxID=2782176 RepID=A0ABY4AGK3_9BURK|nr:SurA N-terminal domain-containing protein [Orrella daihaiensis]UOD49314.1 SurA N-terminal domain-containing protein [Orrella daihaiensis]